MFESIGKAIDKLFGIEEDKNNTDEFLEEIEEDIQTELEIAAIDAYNSIDDEELEGFDDFMKDLWEEDEDE